MHLELLAHKDAITGGTSRCSSSSASDSSATASYCFERYGATASVTGAQPDAVLDAAHLYTFAERPVHIDGGGLLLRADVHRLFDRLLLTFNPETWRSQVAP